MYDYKRFILLDPVVVFYYFYGNVFMRMSKHYK